MGSEVTIRPLGEPGDLGWVVMAHGERYFEEFGWDTSFEALVARIVAEYAARPESDRQAAWIAMMEGRRVGCVFCCTKDEDTAQLRLLLTDPSARGKGLGSELVRRCVDFALQAGYERVVLWTNDVLVAAARIYLAAGFTLVEEEPHHSFGVDLIGQVYELEFTADTWSKGAFVLARGNVVATGKQRPVSVYLCHEKLSARTGATSSHHRRPRSSHRLAGTSTRSSRRPKERAFDTSQDGIGSTLRAS